MSTSIATNTPDSPTYAERIRFDDGDHLTISVISDGEFSGRVEVEGQLDGDPVYKLLEHRDANHQAGLLCSYAHDALWSLPWDRMERIGRALHAAAVTARFVEPTEGADSARIPTPETERVALDDGHADIEAIDQHVELSVSIAGRIATGIALSADEADRISQALTTAAHQARVHQAQQTDMTGLETVCDFVRRARETGTTAAALVEAVQR